MSRIVNVLPLLPPDAVIKGFIGDGNSWCPFETTAGKARAEIAFVCEWHAKNHAEHHVKKYVKEPTTPASTWFYSRDREPTVTLPDFPGVTLYLDTPSGPNTDVRTDPWVLRRVTVDYTEFACWDDPSTCAEEVSEWCLRLKALMDTLSGSPEGVTP